MTSMATTTIDELYSKALEALDPSEVQELAQRLKDSAAGQSANDDELVDEERAFLQARVEKGRRDSAAGRVIPHDKVVTWFESLGTDNEVDPPTWK